MLLIILSNHIYETLEKLLITYNQTLLKDFSKSRQPRKKVSYQMQDQHKNRQGKTTP